MISADDRFSDACVRIIDVDSSAIFFIIGSIVQDLKPLQAAVLRIDIYSTTVTVCIIIINPCRSAAEDITLGLIDI